MENKCEYERKKKRSQAQTMTNILFHVRKSIQAAHVIERPLCIEHVRVLLERFSLLNRFQNDK